MLKKLARTLGLASLLLSATSQALPIVQADAFAAGDNKAALETSTGLVWMDFGVNSHRTFSDVVSSLDTDYAGWRFPTATEVGHLWTSLFGNLNGWFNLPPTTGIFHLSEDNPYGLPVTEYDSYMNSIMEVFGYSEESTSDYSSYEDGVLVYSITYISKSSFAVFSDAGKKGFVIHNLPLNETRVSRDARFAYDTGLPFLENESSLFGTLLVKDSVAVPEPASGLLAVLAIFMLAVRRFKFRV